MASLEDILKKTFLFVAADDTGLEVFKRHRHTAAEPIAFSPPTPPPLPARDPENLGIWHWVHDPTPPPGGDPENLAVWHWVHDPITPAKLTNVSAWVRSAGHAGMRMPVADAIEVESISITSEPNLPPFDLPLTQEFVLAKFHLEEAVMKHRSRGWWQLAAKLDHSLLVVFGYELVQADGVPPRALDLEKIEKMGSRFFPTPEVPSDDPDASPVPPGTDRAGPGLTPVTLETNQSVTAFIAPTWVIVAVGFSTCKERADFEPGGVLGAGRLYPHVMVTCNHDLTRVECKVNLVRPLKTMPHDAEMQLNIGAIMMTDTNEDHRIASVGGVGSPPIPIWSNFFDYYELNPGIGQEFCFVDPKKTTKRTISGAIKRESTFHLGTMYQASSPFIKLPRQGEFDNIHIAPRMRFSNETTGLVINDIAMAPFCIHDCLHTHTRWGLPGPSVRPFNKGFDGRKPYAAEGAPLVPANQTVFVTRTAASSIKYRAVAEGPIKPGTFSVFFHHGSAYALAVPSPTTFKLARVATQMYVQQCGDPFVDVSIFSRPMAEHLGTAFIMRDVDGVQSVAAFYQRLRFMGKTKPDTWMERIQILDLARCRAA